MFFFQNSSKARARTILRRKDKQSTVILLGTHGHGELLLRLPHTQRHCNVVAVVDDFRSQTSAEYFDIPLITSSDLKQLACSHSDLVAINTCERPNPKRYFEQLCRQHDIPCIDYQNAISLLELQHLAPGERVRRNRGVWFHTLATIADNVIAWLPWPRHSNDKVVLVRLDGTGDFMIWQHVAGAIRNHYAKQEITLFAYHDWADYAASLPYWDKVVSVDHFRFTSELLYRWKIQLRIRFRGYGIAINPMRARFTYGDDLIRASHAPLRIGSATDSLVLTDAQKKRGDAWYTHLIKTPLDTYAPQIIYNALFTSQLIGKDIYPSIQILPINQSIAHIPEKPYCIMFPGAGWHGKRWPTQNFGATAAHLQQSFDWTIVLCGGAEEKPLCNEIAKELQQNVINIAGKTSLAELIELIRHAQLLISNDTSAIHIAPAVETPSICILGGGHYGAFLPYPESLTGKKPLVAMKPMDCYHCNWHCTQHRQTNGPVPCVEQVPVKDVINLAHQAIGYRPHISL